MITHHGNDTWGTDTTQETDFTGIADVIGYGLNLLAIDPLTQFILVWDNCRVTINKHII